MTTPATITVRPVTVDDAAELWKILSHASDTVGMGSLPSSLEAADSLCDESATLLAALAAGSYVPESGRIDHPSDGVVGLTGCSFKHDIPNLGVRVETGRDGLGLAIHSASQPWTRTELDSSYLHPDSRGAGYGAVLSRGRLMLLNLLRPQIPHSIVSHLRGMFDEDGHAPFWGHFGRHFAPQWDTSIAAERALRADPSELEALADKSLPLHPELLGCLGKVNAASLPAFRTLVDEGLSPTELFDPVDGGPTVRATLTETVTHRVRIHGRTQVMSEVEGPNSLISTVAIGSFRLTRGPARGGEDGSIVINEGTAFRLGVDTGRLIAAAPLVKAGDLVEPNAARRAEAR